MGLDAYRFSIAWSWLLSDGRGEINPKGLEYYDNLIDELIRHGITPHVTIYHFDLPQSLQDEYNGQLSPKFIGDYTAYADACFQSFGDRVKYWVTVNEPNVEPLGSFDTGTMPPQRSSYPFGTNCTVRDSTTEAYIAAHHLLLAHASAVSLYRDKYQATQGGEIGITLLGWWHEPATNSSQDVAAAMRMHDFHIGRRSAIRLDRKQFLYRKASREARKKGKGLEQPKKAKEKQKRDNSSCSWIISEGVGPLLDLISNQTSHVLNQQRCVYASFGVWGLPSGNEEQSKGTTDYYADAGSNSLKNIQKGSFEFAPWDLGKLLDHLRLMYRNPPVMIHENGYGEESEKIPRKIEYDDDYRSEFLQNYMEVLYQSIQNGSDMRGYFVWSFLDVFEFLYGYRSRYGLIGVDMNVVGRTRYMRKSTHRYSGFLNGSELRPPSLPGKAYSAA
ncbi:unnamed protein product [Alopecurus aequalis]